MCAVPYMMRHEWPSRERERRGKPCFTHHSFEHQTFFVVAAASNIRRKELYTVQYTNSFHQKRIKHILLSVGFFFHDPFVARSGELKKNASAPRTLSFFTLLRIKIILTPSKKEGRRRMKGTSKNVVKYGKTKGVGE